MDKEAKRLYTRQCRAVNVELNRQRQKVWREKNREVERIRKREYRKTHKDVTQKYYYAHRDEILAKQRQKYAENPEPQRTASRIYYRLNLERIKIYKVGWNKRNRSRMRLQRRMWYHNNIMAIQWRYKSAYREDPKKYRERNRRRGIGRLDKETLEEVYRLNVESYSRLTCYLCGNPVEFGEDCLEHKIPLCRGGTFELRNLGIAHRTCNLIKGRRTPDECVGELWTEQDLKLAIERLDQLSSRFKGSP